MTVRLGKIELTAVQSLHTEESRTLVEQRVPEQQGSVFQDLGREPVTLVLEGLLLGEGALATLEKLRAAQAKTEALSFAADIAVGSELTDVVIEDFRARQVAGYAARFRFSLRLREHVEPPQAASAATAPVDSGVQSDAAGWADDNVAAAGVLQDPASLGGALAERPGLLQQMDMDDLGASLTQNMDMLYAGQLNGMLGAVGDLDPSKAQALMEGVKKAGGLGDMIAKYAAQGMALIDKVRKIGGLLGGVGDILDFLKALKQVADDAVKLVGDVGQLELPPEIGQIVKRGAP
jgi:hypothetical protein